MRAVTLIMKLEAVKLEGAATLPPAISSLGSVGVGSNSRSDWISLFFALDRGRRASFFPPHTDRCRFCQLVLFAVDATCQLSASLGAPLLLSVVFRSCCLDWGWFSYLVFICLS